MSKQKNTSNNRIRCDVDSCIYHINNDKCELNSIKIRCICNQEEANSPNDTACFSYKCREEE